MTAFPVLLTAFVTLTTAQQSGVIQPRAETCGPKTANIVCTNHYAAVMPSHFGRNALACEHFEEDFLAKAHPYLNSIDRNKDLTTLKPTAKFEIFKLYGLIRYGWHPGPSWQPDTTMAFAHAPMSVRSID